MSGPRVLAVAAVGLLAVAVGGLIFEGPRSAIYPAAAAITCGLSLSLQTRYRDTMKQWTRRRIADTTVVVVLAAAVIVGGTRLAGPGNTFWTMPITTVTVLIATVPFAVAGLLRDAREGRRATKHTPNQPNDPADPTI